MRSKQFSSHERDVRPPRPRVNLQRQFSRRHRKNYPACAARPQPMPASPIATLTSPR
jgi:hypothetical protein